MFFSSLFLRPVVVIARFRERGVFRGEHHSRFSLFARARLDCFYFAGCARLSLKIVSERLLSQARETSSTFSTTTRAAAQISSSSRSCASLRSASDIVRARVFLLNLCGAGLSPTFSCPCPRNPLRARAREEQATTTGSRTATSSRKTFSQSRRVPPRHHHGGCGLKNVRW